MSSVEREAKFQDLLRAAAYMDCRIGIKNITTLQWGKSSTIPTKGFVVFTGKNGSGKTRILSALSETSEPTFEFGNNTINIKPDSKFYYYSPSEQVINLRKECKRYIGDETKEDILSQYDPIDFDAELVDYLNFILASTYAKVSIYEIADGDIIIPYIQVQSDEEIRDIEQLSHGETYCIHLLWLLKYKMANATLIIDEPETYLYPSAQNRLAKSIIYFKPKNKEQVLIATHSREFISFFKQQTVLNIVKIDRKNYTISDWQETSVDDSYKTEMYSQEIFIFAEDAKTSIFLEHLIQSIDELCNMKFNVIQCKNGEGDLHSIESRFQRTKNSRIIYCYDGDSIKNNSIQDDIKNFSLYLPGNEPPDAVLKKSVIKNRLIFAEMLSEKIKPELVVSAVDEHTHANHHDFLIGIASTLGIPEHFIIKKAFELWRNDKSNEESINAFQKLFLQILKNVS